VTPAHTSITHVTFATAAAGAALLPPAVLPGPALAAAAACCSNDGNVVDDADVNAVASGGRWQNTELADLATGM
jgi:hypothetical protein